MNSTLSRPSASHLAHHRRRRARSVRVTTLNVILLTGLVLIGATACGAGPASTDTSTAPPPLTLADPYVKAESRTGDMPMSAIFGVLRNSSDQEVTVVSAASDAATTVELHEMVMTGGKMKMQPREGGFVIPPKGELALDPGGLHIMLIGLTRDIRPGDEVAVTLTTSDGSMISATAVGRDLANANESYDPSPSASSHG